MNHQELAKKAIAAATANLGGSLQRSANHYLKSAINLYDRGEHWSAAKDALKSLAFSVEITTPLYRELSSEVFAALYDVKGSDT